MVFFTVVLALWFMIQDWDLLARYSKDLPLKSLFGGVQPRKCAPWIPKADRKVAFVSIATMKDYYKARGYKGGEFYMSATLDYALRQNGFRVDTFLASTMKDNSPQENEKLLSPYHRVFTNGLDVPEVLGFHNVPWMQQRCKYRSFAWWGLDGTNGLPKDDTDLHSKRHENSTARYNHRQFLLAFPGSDFQGTFLGFFPHSLLWKKKHLASSTKRNKVALLLGKTASRIQPLMPILPTLLQNGFEIHTTCNDCASDFMLSPNVTTHRNVGPFDFIRILQSSVVLIGSGRPLDSPSPLEGLASGVAFLNPILNSRANVDLSSATRSFGISGAHPTQHAPLMLLGSPYVYNVRLDNYTQVAMAAVDNRFASYVPPDYRVEALEARVCSILEDDALCRCSTPIDCWGSSVVRNTPMK